MFLPPCGYAFSECFFCFLQTQTVLKLSSEMLPPISKLKILIAKDQKKAPKQTGKTNKETPTKQPCSFTSSSYELHSNSGASL